MKGSAGKQAGTEKKPLSENLQFNVKILLFHFFLYVVSRFFFLFFHSLDRCIFFDGLFTISFFLSLHVIFLMLFFAAAYAREMKYSLVVWGTHCLSLAPQKNDIGIQQRSLSSTNTTLRLLSFYCLRGSRIYMHTYRFDFWLNWIETEKRKCVAERPTEGKT